MVNFGLLVAEIVSLVWDIPANFNGFRVLASLLQRRRSMEASQTLHNVWPLPGLVDYIYTQRVRSRSEDRRARPGGGSRSSGAPTTAAGNLSVATDGPPEAIRSVDDVAAATKRRTTSRLTICGSQVGISGRFPHSSNYFR